jgi:dipeptidyl aminopeptidase/acylaminoacyl peptidase
MISKQTGRQAQRVEKLAGIEESAGHARSALELWAEAAELYMRAQHPVFEVNDEKRFLYAGLQRCYDKVIELAGYRIERIDVPWEGTVISGYLHLNPALAGVAGPLLLAVPGSDTTAEGSPDVTANRPFLRGLHVFSMDGPGQGRSNMRGIRLTPDNYERAASAVLDALVRRPEIDPERIAVFGSGMGGYWAMRVAAHDRRIKAAATKSSDADKYVMVNEDSPRYAQLFAFLTQSTTEEELAAVMGAMDVVGPAASIACPTLMVAGEYDHRDPMDEVYRVFDALGVPGELWVFADQFHKTKLPGGGHTVPNMMLDWLVDRLEGRPYPNAGKVLYLEQGGMGPNDPKVARKRRWFDEE